MNVDIGTEATLFPEKESINGIFLAVYTTRGAICSKVLPEKIYLCLALIAMSGHLCHHWQECFFPAPPEAPLSLTYMYYQKKALACFGLSS